MILTNYRGITYALIPTFEGYIAINSSITGDRNEEIAAGKTIEASKRNAEIWIDGYLDFGIKQEMIRDE